MSINVRAATRPGYFGRRKAERIAEFNSQYGEGNWWLRWIHSSEAPLITTLDETYDFRPACVAFYEESYFRYLQGRPDELEFLTQFRECYDNAETNVHSGLEYTRQEAYSTHIQDIAVRNAMRRLNAHFTGANGRLLQIRSRDSEGYRFGPGNVPFFAPNLIRQPSLAPGWANVGSVEDFWQSNKYVVVRV